MTDLRKAAEIALEALSFFGNNVTNPAEEFITSKAINALRQALAQQALADSIRPRGKSITKVWVDEINQALNVNAIDTSKNCVDENEKRERKPWVGLTEDDLRQIILAAVGVAEAKLREKNT